MSLPLQLRLHAVDASDHLIARRLHGLQMMAYAQEAELLGMTHFPPLQRTVEQLRTSGESFLAAYVGDELAGALSTSPDAESDSINVDSLVVLPRFQRRGIAKALLASVIANHGSATLTVQTAVKNAPALALYTLMGFVEVRRWWTEDESLELVQLRRDSS
jgi:ribosomal protein S18 acetylase RimI-like enzyme